MEHYKTSKLLNDSTIWKFLTNKWIEVKDLSSGQYSANKTSMLRLDLCDYSDPYIAVKQRISIRGTNYVNRINNKLTFKNNAPFRSCMSKINNIFVDNAEDLDIVMPMYNLLGYSSNYSIHQKLCGIIIETNK